MLFVNRDYLLKRGVPKIDYHIHSAFSDGRGTIEDYVTRATEKKLKEIAITDHVWKTSPWVETYIKRIKEVRKVFSYTVYAGVEAKAINLHGDVDVDKKIAPKLDMISGVVHRYPSEENYVFRDPKSLTPERGALIETEAILGMIKRAKVHVIAHPLRSYHLFFSDSKRGFPLSYIDEIVKAAKRHSIALEFCSRWCKQDDFLKICLKENAPISFGSDSHTPETVGEIGEQRILSILRET